MMILVSAPRITSSSTPGPHGKRFQTHCLSTPNIQIRRSSDLNLCFGLRGTEMQSDDIIVGAGSCGAALAARLSEDASFCSKLVPGYRTIKETPDDLLDRTISMATTAG